MKNEKVKMAKEEKGIEGWLSFFIFSLMASLVINFIGAISDISIVIESLDISLIILDIIYWLALIGFNVYAIYVLAKLKKNGVSVAKMYLFLVFLTNFTGVVFSLLIGTPLASETSYFDSSAMIFRSLAFSLIWFLYLTYSKRIESTYPKKNRITYTIDKIWFFFVLAICLVVYFLAYVNINSEPLISDNSTQISLQPIKDELDSGYVVFRPFSNQDYTNELTSEFNSDLPIDVYFIPSEEDYNKFMEGNQYNTYQGCFFEEKTFGVISCNVSTGGILVYNPNSQPAKYSIS